MPVYNPTERPADNALYAIIGTNVVVVLGALISDGGLLYLMWPYWLQSVIIGWYARRRIRVLTNYSTEGVKVNGSPVDPTPATARNASWFFLFHYGGFHFVYAIFLLSFGAMGAESGTVPVTIENTGEVVQFEVGYFGGLDWLWVLVTGVGFWLSHRASHREHVASDLAGRPNLGTLMFLPYGRIIPMHLTIIFGVILGGGGAILLFGGLKTAVDVVMHKLEHRLLRKGTLAGGEEIPDDGRVQPLAARMPAPPDSSDANAPPRHSQARRR